MPVKLNEVGDTVKLGVTYPACVTLIILSVTSVALNVIVPLLAAELVLAEALIVDEPLFVPELDETVSHDVALLLTVQLVFEVTEILCEFSEAVQLMLLEGDIVTKG